MRLSITDALVYVVIVLIGAGYYALMGTKQDVIPLLIAMFGVSTFWKTRTPGPVGEEGPIGPRGKQGYAGVDVSKISSAFFYLSRSLTLDNSELVIPLTVRNNNSINNQITRIPKGIALQAGTYWLQYKIGYVEFNSPNEEVYYKVTSSIQGTLLDGQFTATDDGVSLGSLQYVVSASDYEEISLSLWTGGDEAEVHDVTLFVIRTGN